MSWALTHTVFFKLWEHTLLEQVGSARCDISAHRTSQHTAAQTALLRSALPATGTQQPPATLGKRCHTDTTQALQKQKGWVFLPYALMLQHQILSTDLPQSLTTSSCTHSSFKKQQLNQNSFLAPEDLGFLNDNMLPCEEVEKWSCLTCHEVLKKKEMKGIENKNCPLICPIVLLHLH